MPRCTIEPWFDDGLGARLKAAREAKGLSQRQLSFPGCTAAYISRLEANARSKPSLQMIEDLANRLDTTRDFLAWGKEPNLSMRVASASKKHQRVLERVLNLLQSKDTNPDVSQKFFGLLTNCERAEKTRARAVSKLVKAVEVLPPA